MQTPHPNQPIIYKKQAENTETKAKKTGKKQTTGFEKQTVSLKPPKLEEILQMLKTQLLNGGISVEAFLEKAATELVT